MNDAVEDRIRADWLADDVIPGYQALLVKWLVIMIDLRP
jgi:hypothetical protein